MSKVIGFVVMVLSVPVMGFGVRWGIGWLGLACLGLSILILIAPYFLVRLFHLTNQGKFSPHRPDWNEWREFDVMHGALPIRGKEEEAICRKCRQTKTRNLRYYI